MWTLNVTWITSNVYPIILFQDFNLDCYAFYVSDFSHSEWNYKIYKKKIVMFHGDDILNKSGHLSRFVTLLNNRFLHHGTKNRMSIMRFL